MIRRPPRSTQSRSSAASDVYKRQGRSCANPKDQRTERRTATRNPGSALWIQRMKSMNRTTIALSLGVLAGLPGAALAQAGHDAHHPGTPLSLIHISEPTRLGMISYAVFCLKKKKKNKNRIINTIKYLVILTTKKNILTLY